MNRLVNQKPIISYSLSNYNGKYATNSSSLDIKCSHPIACTIECRLYETASLPQPNEEVSFGRCLTQPFASQRIQNGLDYVFEIKASDSVNNSPDLARIEFTADTLPPTLASPPLAAYSGDCGDDLSSVVKPPTLVDNYDPIPQSSYVDRKVTSCSIRREWTATDHVNNSAVYTQMISLTPQSTITYPDTFNLSCVTNAQVLKV